MLVGAWDLCDGLKITIMCSLFCVHADLPFPDQLSSYGLTVESLRLLIVLSLATRKSFPTAGVCMEFLMLSFTANYTSS